MAGIIAITDVLTFTNIDVVADFSSGDAVSGKIVSGFSIDVSADLLPSIAFTVALIDAHMAGVVAIAVVVRGANGDGTAVSRKGHTATGIIVRSFSINVTAKLLPTDRPDAAASDRQPAGGCVIDIGDALCC